MRNFTQSRWSKFVSFIMFLALSTAFAFFVAGCGPTPPDKVLENMIETARSGDIDAALSFLTDDSRKRVSAFMITPEMKRYAKERMSEESANLSFQILDVSIDGTNAILKVRISDPEGFNDYPGELPFALEKGEWKLNLAPILDF